jgi:N-methylhydantoinase A/oxoprolinase/acetone carboxylase beta subunit
LDEGGSLRVGPQSAGADPGPACYGRGTEPTVTDANLVLGRIDPDFFLGGRMRIDPERSREAVGRLAARIGKTVLAAAQGIVDIANANMEKAIRVISIERGFDPRVFALFSFGGAGGMHAADLAAALRMKPFSLRKTPAFYRLSACFSPIRSRTIPARFWRPRTRPTDADRATVPGMNGAGGATWRRRIRR